jgi:hypothetical protein
VPLLPAKASSPVSIIHYPLSIIHYPLSTIFKRNASSFDAVGKKHSVYDQLKGGLPMSVCIYELEQRLKDLEEEQNRQNWLLQEEVNRLELELVQNKVHTGRPKASGANGQEVYPSKKIKVPPAKLTPVNNTEATALKRMMAKQPCYSTPKLRTAAVMCEYVIRLTLNPQIPLEWSGQGWTKSGQGRHYPSLELAQKSQQQLAKHWPADCLMIVERQVSEYSGL